MQSDDASWQVQDRFLELRSHWMTLIGEHWRDHQGHLLEYWRVEKADSVIVIPIHTDRILLPAPSYRPGVGQMTLDFPGGRIPPDHTPAQAAIATLQRELGVTENAIAQLVPLNDQGWMINSSFSNQKLYGFVAHLNHSELISALTFSTYSTTPSGVEDLLHQLVCLQCRTVFLEWWFNVQQAV